MQDVQDAHIVPSAGVRPRKRSYIAREIIETVALTLVIFLAIHFSIQRYSVDVRSRSMQPGLHGGDVLLVNLLAYRFGAPQRGDVVIIRQPRTLDPKGQLDPLIKRIIAIPGDTVTISATAVYVNGKKLNEPYLEKLPPDGVETVTGIVSNLKMGKDQYWVMGDNRRDSTDSRSFGIIARDEIIGKAEVVIWPLNRVQWVPTYSDVFAQLTP